MTRGSGAALALSIAALLPVSTQAQGIVVAAELGPQYLRQNFPMQFDKSYEASVDPAVSVSAGLRLGPVLLPELNVRSTAARHFPFRSASLGLGIQVRQLRHFHAHAGIARIQAAEPIYCGFGPCTSPDYKYESRWGLEVRAGFDLKAWQHFRVGPVAWWTHSIDRIHMYTEHYHMVGAGLRIGYQ